MWPFEGMDVVDEVAPEESLFVTIVTGLGALAVGTLVLAGIPFVIIMGIMP